MFFSHNSCTEYLWVVDKIFVEVILNDFFFLYFFKFTSGIVLLCEDRKFFSTNL